MKLAKLKEYYSLGLIDGVSAVPTDGGWLLCVDSKSNPYGLTVKTALGEEKVYSTLDSLDRDVQRVTGSPQSWNMVF